MEGKPYLLWLRDKVPYIVAVKTGDNSYHIDKIPTTPEIFRGKGGSMKKNIHFGKSAIHYEDSHTSWINRKN